MAARTTGPPDSELREHVARLRGDLVAIRRRLHARPELAFEEHETAALAAARCTALGMSVRTGVGGTGVLADLDGARPGPAVLVRADMDALPIQEGDDGRPVRSEVPGVMHACGHDGHVAIALGVADVLAAMREHWSGRVRMCFQPAEETDEGAARMIADGALDGIDRAVGVHLIATQPTGTVAIGPGVRWAGSDELRVVVRGAGGHAGAPGATVDPILVAAEIALALERVTRETRAPAVAKVGIIRAGTAPNIVPETVELAGTLRTFDAHDRRELLAEIRALAEAAAAARGATLEWTEGSECPPVDCDLRATDRVRTALVGEFELLALRPSTASDDMARYLDAVPGVYFTVGAGGPGALPHHHPLFDLDEAALPRATEALALATLALLED